MQLVHQREIPFVGRLVTILCVCVRGQIYCRQLSDITATHCNTPQHTVIQCSTVRHIAIQWHVVKIQRHVADVVECRWIPIQPHVVDVVEMQCVVVCACSQKYRGQLSDMTATHRNTVQHTAIQRHVVDVVECRWIQFGDMTLMSLYCRVLSCVRMWSEISRATLRHHDKSLMSLNVAECNSTACRWCRWIAVCCTVLRCVVDVNDFTVCMKVAIVNSQFQCPFERIFRSERTLEFFWKFLDEGEIPGVSRLVKSSKVSFVVIFYSTLGSKRTFNILLDVGKCKVLAIW